MSLGFFVGVSPVPPPRWQTWDSPEQEEPLFFSPLKPGQLVIQSWLLTVVDIGWRAIQGYPGQILSHHLDLSCPVSIDLVLKCLQVNWLLFQADIDFQITILIIFHLAIFLSLCSGSLENISLPSPAQEADFLPSIWQWDTETERCSRAETHLWLCPWKGHRTHHDVYQQRSTGRPHTPCHRAAKHNAVFVMSGRGWSVHVNSLDIQDRCSACWFPPSLGGPTFWKLQSPDEPGCSSPPGVACVPVHIRTESFNRYTLTFKTAGDTTSIPALVLLMTKHSLWNRVFLLEIYLPLHIQHYLNMPNRNRTSFPGSTQI